MSERKYTDEEIIDEVNAYIQRSCRMCEFKALCNDLCAIEFIKAALDLITRQKAEIAVLTTAVDNSTKEFLKLHDEYQDQKEEIEKLQEVNADLNESLRLAAEANKDMKIELDAMRGAANSYKMRYENARAEAIKEFVVRLKANMCHGYPYLEIEEDLFRRDVDNLVAEMTEGE